MTNNNFVARGSAWIQRAPEDGKDGVGITSADVVFAQSKSNTNPPADTDVWKTKVDELSLVDGYLWSGTKIIYSNKKIAITGKYCIGSTRDFTDIEELYYLSDSGDKIPTNVTFQSSFKPEKGKYLWTCIRYRFKAPSGSAENSNWVYSTPTCAGYFGDDGVSVQSSDVVFAISESKTTAPTTGWITNFGGLTLTEGKYVWTCTKTTLTDGDSYYTGAYCLGECYDFAQVDELYALGSSATKSPDIDSSLGVNIWQSSYTPKKGMYLWTCVRVTYNSNTPPYYLNKKCVSYFPTDGNNGTSFNLLGTAEGHMKTWVKPSPFSWNSIYLVDGANGGYPMTYKITTEGVKSAKANVGDAYIIGGNLWVANTTEWVNVGNIQGAPGEPGEDALNIELSTDKILFSWDSKNKSYDVATKDITLIVKQGNNIINIDDYTINFQAVENFELGSNNKNIRTDGASDGYTYNISVYSAGIAMQEYTFNASVNDKKQTVKYPASSCSVKMLITYNGITYTKIIAIEVSFVQMYGDLAWNTEQLSSTYGELVSTGGRLYTMESKIAQNAKDIALKVSQTYYDENNKKVGERFSIIEQRVDKINIQVSATSDGLKNTGINITDGTIKMTAANFTLVNNNGVPTLGVDAFGNCSLKGTINATGGNFGSLQMTSFTDATGFEFYGMSAHTDGTSIIAASTYRLDYQGLYVGSGLRNNGGSVHIGNRGGITDGDFSWDEGVVNVEADNSGASNADISGIGVNVVGNPSHSAIGMKVSATGGKNNYAIYAENGDFRAENGAFIGVHRGNVKKIDNDYTLEKTDSTIICTNKNKGITINLPKLSKFDAGTFYRIIRRGNSVTFKSYTMNIFFVSRGDLMSSVSSELASEWINCFWDGEYWYVEMSGN